jgi:hypothetical protein
MNDEDNVSTDDTIDQIDEKVTHSKEGGYSFGKDVIVSVVQGHCRQQQQCIRMQIMDCHPCAKALETSFVPTKQ